MKRSGSVSLCGLFVLLVVSVFVIVAPTLATAETATVLWEGNVTLTNETTFSYVPSNNASASYTVSTTTDLGALIATGLTLNASDSWYASYGSFSINSIGGIENEPWVAGVSRSWAIFVNDAQAPKGLSGNNLVDGDNVKFYFCPWGGMTALTENASYLVNITVNVVDILFEGTVTLKNETTFSYVPSNNASASYTVSTTTDLGALIATGLTLNASDSWYASYGSFSINSIGGIENEPWVAGVSRSWAIFVNDAQAPKGLSGNNLVDGDNVKFYFCPWGGMTALTENASYLVNITVNVVDILFEGTVTLKNETTFSYVPSNNASASYTVSTTTDLGALIATGLALNASDSWYASYGTFWLESIADIENEVWPSSTWAIYINDVPASKGLGGNELEDGDNVKFYFCPADSTTYAYITENASYLVNITVNVTALPTSTPTTPRRSGGGGRVAPPAKTGETLVSTDPTGKVTTTTIATSANAKAIVTIPVGTIAKDAFGKAIEKVSVKPASKIHSIPPKVSLPCPPGTTGVKYAYDFGPVGAAFSEPVEISISFDPTDFHEGTTPVIYTYETGEWKSLDTTVIDNRAVTKVYHFSTFVLFAKEKVAEVISTPTPTPTLLPVATLTPTPAPIPTTKPRISGFEAVLAIAGLLAVAYLVLSKKRK